MKIPSSIENLNIPTLDESIQDLLNSISQEEAALSKLISSEAKKINAFVGKDHTFPTCKNSQEIVEFSHTVNQLVDSVIMKEWLLLKKLEAVLSIKNRLEKKSNYMYCEMNRDDEYEE